MAGSLEALLEFVRSNRRVCPLPKRWNELWEMLPESSTRRSRLGSTRAADLGCVVGHSSSIEDDAARGAPSVC